MIIRHQGENPVIHPEATVSPAAVISGKVTIGAGTVILAGAVISSEGGAIEIGECCVIMENAVIRGTRIAQTRIERYTLIGPHTHISGAKIGEGCFIATGSSIFNGVEMGKGCVIAVNAIVHINSKLKEGEFVPMGHIFLGNPGKIYSPGEAALAHEELSLVGFTNAIFGFDSSSMSNLEATIKTCEKYSRYLARHRDDTVSGG